MIFYKIKKDILKEYLIKEIDNLEPIEYIYKIYINNLLKISNKKFLNTISGNSREKFISLLNLVDKKDIICFCIEEKFVIEKKEMEDILGRTLGIKDYD